MSRAASLPIAAVLIMTIAWSQSKGPAAGDATGKMLQQAKQTGMELPAEHNVSEEVTVEAVLIPYNLCRRIFGKEIADTYAAIEINVGNKSKEATLIVHDVFIDYHEWSLSGLRPAAETHAKAGARTEGQNDLHADAKDQGDKSGKKEKRKEKKNKWESRTEKGEVASVESRIARGQLLEAQPWTKRNLTIHILEALGSIASGYQFALKEKGLIRGIASFNGNVIPGVEHVLPDSTITQANRISDFGFQVNKVIPKEGAEVIVGFFPIDRFLTPGLKRLFQKSPAMFFAPLSMLVDPIVAKDVRPLLEQAFGKDLLENEMKSLREALLDKDEEKAMDTPLGRFLSGASLNNVHVVVNGIMTVDVMAVPGTITSIDFEGGNGSATVWADPGERKATIRGSHLSGGTVKILEAEQLGIKDIAVLDTGSTDQELHFKFTLTKAIPNNQDLTFQVIKKDKDDKPVESTKFTFRVNYILTAPQIDGVERKDSKLTITGRNFFDTPPANALSVVLHPSGVTGLSDVPVKKVTVAAAKLEADLSGVDLKPHLSKLAGLPISGL